MENKKYEINKDGRCVALRSFYDVKEGDIGGFVESEENLSQEGNCWVYEDAKVSGNCLVYEDAKVSGNASVSECALVFGNVCVYGNAKVFGYAQVSRNANVYEDAEVSGNAKVFGNAQVSRMAIVSGHTESCTRSEETAEAIPSDAAKILARILAKIDQSKILENLLDSPVESLTMDGITYKKTVAKWERE